MVALQKLSNLTQTEVTQAILWIAAFAGVCVLVGIDKVPPTMLENLLFALVGGMAMRGKGNGESSK